MKILVVDDEPLARERMRRMLAAIQPEAEVLEAGSGEQALEQVASGHPDLLLLDISMPGMDGIAVAKALLELARPPAVIFCTAFDRFAVAAFEQQAVGYLVKPVREEQLAEAIARAGRLNRMQLSGLATTAGGRTHLSSESHRGVEHMGAAEIRCFLAEQKYVRACTVDRSILLTESLKELEAEFSDDFVRVHRNALVNLRHVVGLRREQGGWRVELAGIEDRPLVSRRHLAEVKDRLRQQ
jgi:two-component system response regulator AlgR